MSIFRIVAVLIAFAGCKSQPVTPVTTTNPQQPPPPTDSGDDMGSAVAASNRFGLTLYERLRSTSGNLAYSPASISMALSMTHAGARGDTAQEMSSTLALPDSIDAVGAGWAGVLGRWQEVTGVDIAVANRLFGDEKYTFEPAYLALTGSLYGAPLEAVDFAGAPQEQRKRINEWVAEQTRARIKDLIPASGVTSDTRMALVNAMYFKAGWRTPFDAERTADGAFAAPTGSVQVPMMMQTEFMQYGQVGGVKLAQRLYANSEFAALFVLPMVGQDIGDLEEQLDAPLFDTWTSSLKRERVAMKMPRFKVDPASSFDLTAALKDMGMEVPFDRMRADFTGITNPSNPADRLFIEKVFHKAFVEMDETGTEAAAATAVMMGRAGGIPSEPVTFEADRPFLFFVRDVQTGLVLFAGRVVDPTR